MQEIHRQDLVTLLFLINVRRVKLRQAVAPVTKRGFFSKQRVIGLYMIFCVNTKFLSRVNVTINK